MNVVFTRIGLILCLTLVGVGCRQRAPGSRAAPAAGKPLTVYCAAGIRLPVEAAAKRYEQEFGTEVRIDYGSSGELEGRLEIDRQAGKSRCDIYIPADTSFAQRTRNKELTQESLPLAEFHLVLAKHPDCKLQATTTEELLASGVPYVVCDKTAGVGAKTHKVLSAAGAWDAIDAKKKSSFPRVPEAANAIKTAKDVEAGFIWDTTAHQFQLDVLHLKELAAATSQISANVVASTSRPTAALRFARYLAATDRGQEEFAKYGFTAIGTDPWEDQPQLVVYCGGVNRTAVDKTLRDFEAREGVTIKEQYAGCGTLVTGIQAIAGGSSRHPMPDAFMTCDTSYMTKVEDLFEMPSDVSSTRIVMLVRKGNPRAIHKIADLAQPNVAIGVTNPKMSTLGDLSQQLFRDAGIESALAQAGNILVMTPTAHELIMQMTGHQKLDVVLVYEANCQSLSADFERIPIDHDLAKAVQNVAASKATPYPALASRLLATLQSEASRKRFEVQGFTWRGTP